VKVLIRKMVILVEGSFENDGSLTSSGGQSFPYSSYTMNKNDGGAVEVATLSLGCRGLVWLKNSFEVS
jgi:hypothetical protein